MGFRFWVLGFGVWGLGFGVWGLGSWISGLGFRVSGFGLRVSDLGFRMKGFKSWNLRGAAAFQRRRAPEEARIHLHVFGSLFVHDNRM